MAGKTFEDYQAAYAKDPYPFPMPGGAAVDIPQPTIRTEAEAVAAATGAATYADGLFAGLRVYAGDAGGDKIAEAWGKLPTAALASAVDGMREHFTVKKS